VLMHANLGREHPEKRKITKPRPGVQSTSTSVPTSKENETGEGGTGLKEKSSSIAGEGSRETPRTPIKRNVLAGGRIANDNKKKEVFPDSRSWGKKIWTKTPLLLPGLPSLLRKRR